jgi:uncharacterized protein (TIGR02757 family)
VSALVPFLDQLCAQYHRTEHLQSDPLEFVHRYTDPWDREAVAILAALLAYGNVKQIRRSVALALERMSEHAGSPATYVRGLQGRRASAADRKLWAGYVHRFNTGEDLMTLFELVARSWAEHGSVGAHFLAGLATGAPDFGSALDRLIDDWSAWAGPVRMKGSFSYFLTAPRDGSCCKRWCMLLRWMGRRDELDPGLWSAGSGLEATFPMDPATGRRLSLRADQLVIPLDTHTGRISQYLGLTRRKSLNWKAALEVTEALRACDPRDPVRYDFALSRLGILDRCQRAFRKEICVSCQLLPVCRYARRRGAGRGLA